jgi:hypothetical protein
MATGEEWLVDGAVRSKSGLTRFVIPPMAAWLHTVNSANRQRRNTRQTSGDDDDEEDCATRLASSIGHQTNTERVGDPRREVVDAGMDW